MTHRLLAMLLFSLLLTAPTAAQNAPEPDPFIASTYLNAINVRSGPGETFAAVTSLGKGIPVRIVERNRVGTWLHIQRDDGAGNLLLDGWAVGGYLDLADNLRYSELSVNETLPDADPNSVNSQSMKLLYAVPVMPFINPAMKDVFLKGLQMGNRSNVVTKVGDSLVANEYYLQPMNRPDNNLGHYDFLAETMAYFGAGAAETSAAARVGLSTAVIFDPMWADSTRCNAGETALDCEYRLKMPSVALVMFGPNDVLHISPKAYYDGMEKIVQRSLEKGVIPVLFTFSYNPDSPSWQEALAFNLSLVEIANQYQVPLVNLWAAARIIPEYGLDTDLVHLKNSGFEYLNFANGNEAFYGVAMQNLLAVRVLDEIRHSIIMTSLAG